MKSTWSSSTELGAFLRSRRAALSPEETGMSSCGQRRVPGLRREELAFLAGISVTYYTRLERGESHQVSDSVLDSLASVFKLTPDERAYLVRLARPTRTGSREGEPEQLRPAVQALIDSAGGQAAIVVGRRADVLGGNRLGFALWGLRAPDSASDEPRPNIALITFLDPSARDLFPDWESQARDISAYLRHAAAHHPDDQELHALIGELSVHSPEFATIWSDHPVSDCLSSQREYRHPRVGTMVLNEEVVRLTDSPGVRIIFSGADEGTPSAERLRLLATLT
ncbi:helix-turn-helix transcriptional regulator [Streptomyces thermoviolaceus]|uniref:helix-turn-helix transcriptional regulator n=1 Tax=Streptomyces thermoviolaceus TaxID=1952 RepID=UPI001E2FA349|nr:helix-turn-helix transcriptional regulator [Streptomyces thermoviolaceus]WTD46233.1 helix-turn-helix transcriptional regulator [Streptomyces thermoviolaceus]